MTQESNKNLLILAAFLEKLPRERFDYSTWVGADYEGKPDLSCGTTACALGWTVVIPQFKKLGLSAGANSGSFFTINGRVVPPSTVIYRLFGDDAYYPHGLAKLFYPNESVYVNDKRIETPGIKATPKQVAKVIRQFVSERKKEAKATL